MATTASALTSTTAPGKVFTSRSELAEHYKSDWHKYNLKRREAGLPLLKEDDFQARLEAALALRREREQREERSGTDHLKNGTKKKKNKKQQKNNNPKGQTLGGSGSDSGIVSKSQAQAYDDIKDRSKAVEEEKETDETMQDEEQATTEPQDQLQQPEDDMEEEEPPTIEPRQCLFDTHISATVESNVERMHSKYDFFIPDREYLVDLEGFVGYCHEKVKLGQMCLYCQRTFRSYTACQAHMISKAHTKIQYERGIDLDEFDPFYDFSKADEEFYQDTTLLRKKKNKAGEGDESMAEVDEEDEGEWEDVTDDEDMEDVEEEDEDDEDDEGIYAGYEEEVAKYGFDVTPLGELIFPDGRIVGHRGLSRYYKQRAQPTNTDRTAIVAARRAAGERLWKGRVYDTAAAEEVHESSLALARAGITPGSATGRAGNGILVKSSGAGFTALSLYRYKAVVKKARREEFQGRRLQNRTRYNMNRMDKKANRLHNNVSVAHAKR